MDVNMTIGELREALRAAIADKEVAIADKEEAIADKDAAVAAAEVVKREAALAARKHIQDAEMANNKFMYEMYTVQRRRIMQSTARCRDCQSWYHG
jgi:hypothetical protein